MLKTILLLLAPLLLLLITDNALAQQRWKIQEDYAISFSGTKAEGTFRGLEGEILFSASSLKDSKFDVSVLVETISTGNKTKDKHARGSSWFDVAAFPQIFFTSNRISSKKSDEFIAYGNLEIKGIKKESAIQFTFLKEGQSGVFKGTMEVNREDFGIEGNMFAFVVGENFSVELEIPVSIE